MMVLQRRHCNGVWLGWLRLCYVVGAPITGRVHAQHICLAVTVEVDAN